MLFHYLLFLTTLAVCTHGFGLVDNKLALKVKEFTVGSSVSMAPFNQDALLDPSQDWLFNVATGQIHLRYYPNLVLGSSAGYQVLLFNGSDASTLAQTKWNRTSDGTTAQFRNTKFNTFLANFALVVFALPTQYTFQLFNPYKTSDYIVVGAGTAGAKIAKRLTDDFVTSVIAIEAGARVDDNPLVQNVGTIREVESSSFFNFAYYSERIANLGGLKVPAGVGKMWGGTSNHNGMLYDRGLKYDWDEMEEAGGANWNYVNHIQPQFQSQENYTGQLKSGYGKDGEISITDSVDVPAAVTRVAEQALQQFYPSFVRGTGLDANRTGSVSTLQLTMQNLTNGRYIRESSSSAHLHPGVVTPQGQGVGGRKLQLIGETFVDRLIFHPAFPKMAIGVHYIDKNGESQIALAEKEVILSAGVYASPAILMRSGVGNCTELQAHNISCRENNVYVGSNLQDHMRVAVAFSVPISTVLTVAASANVNNTNGHLLEGRIYTNYSNAYTDFNISKDVQPDTKMTMLVSPQIPYTELSTLYKLNWLGPTVSLPGVFELAAILLRPKCVGKLTLASPHFAAHPLIRHNYLCHSDDLGWARTMFRNLSAIVDAMSANDSSYQLLFPPKSMINDDRQLPQVVSALSTSYRHPAGTCRMGARDAENQGVVDGSLRVHGISRVRVVDASVFVTVPSNNLQSAVYALAGRAVELIKQNK